MSRSTKSSTLLIVFSLLFAAVLPAKALPLDFHSYKPPIHAGSQDTDGDGLPNIDELFFGSNSLKPDTDGDGFNDLQEFIAGTDPNSANSFPLVDFTQLRNHQYLTGQSLFLRPIGLTNTVFKIKVTTTGTNADGTPITETNITYLALLLSWYKDGQILNTTTNSVNSTNVVDNGDGTFTTNITSTFTVTGTTNLIENDLPLLIHRLSPSDSGFYHLVATYTNASPPGVKNDFPNFSSSTQISRDIEIEVLPVLPKKLIAQPAGSLAAWGDNSVGLVSGATNASSGTNITAGTNIVSFAAGLTHAVASRADGTVVTWGTNTVGELDAPPITNAVKVVAGARHSVALLADGTVVAWGDNTFGQTNVPVGLSNVISIAAGYFHNAAITSDGKLHMWGDNSSNQCDVPSGLGTVTAVAAGLLHTVAITDDGVVHAWGGNAFGQSTVPQGRFRIEAGSIACGANHTVALLRDGEIIAWGDNSLGQTTLPTSYYRAVKVQCGPDYSVALGLDGKIAFWGNTKASAAAAKGKTNTPAFTDIGGGFNVVFAMKAGPDADADGLNDNFETAAGTQSDFADSDNDGLEDGIELLLGTDPNNPDTDGDGFTDYYEVTHGFNPNEPFLSADSSIDIHLLFRLRFFSVVGGFYQFQTSLDQQDWLNINDPTNLPAGWTDGFFDPLGGEKYFRMVPQSPPPPGPGDPSVATKIFGAVASLGYALPSQSTIPVTVYDVKSISVGFSHDLALRNDGTVAAWGEDESGQTDVPSTLTNAKLIAAGGAHSLAVNETGGVVAWGNNRSGQSTPPAIAGKAVAIAAGLNHSLALSDSGKVYAWGDNSFGQTSIPSTLAKAASIAAGFSHSVAVTPAGKVVAWGDNRYGQCNVPANLPVVKAVAAGYGHTLALLTDGTVRGWGIDTNGEIDIPAGLTGVTAIAAGASHSVALKSDGTLVRWGSSAALQGSLASDFTSITMIAAGGSRTLVVKVPVDTDKDGLDDSFENQLGTDPNNPSTTGDGYTDGWKYFNGFNPLVPIEAIDGATKSYPLVRLNLFTVANSRYQLFGSPDLQNWLPVNSNATNNITGFNTNYFDASASKMFYQLRKLQ